MNRPAELAALQAGAWPPIAEIFHIKALLESTLAPYADLAMSKDLGFQVGYASNLPSSVRGDPVSLERLLTELVINAVDHTATGTIHLLVRHYRSHQDCLELTIADTGPGLSIVRQLQLSTASPLDSATQGLGLALIRHYITHLQGELTVQSQEALGTIITCTFPITIVEEGDKPAQKRFFIISRTALPWYRPARRLPSIWTTLMQKVAMSTAPWPRRAAKTAPTAAPRPTPAPQSPGQRRVSEPSVAASLKIHSANRGARHFNGQRLAGATQSNGYPLRWTVAGWLAPPLRSLARPTVPAVVNSLLARDPDSIYVTTLFIRRIDMLPWFNARGATIPQGAIAGVAQDNPPITTDDKAGLVESQQPSDPSTDGRGPLLASLPQEAYSQRKYSLLLPNEQADLSVVCRYCGSENREGHKWLDYFKKLNSIGVSEKEKQYLKEHHAELVDCLYTNPCMIVRQAAVLLLPSLQSIRGETYVIEALLKSLDNPKERDYAVICAAVEGLLYVVDCNVGVYISKLPATLEQKGRTLSVRVLARMCGVIPQACEARGLPNMLIYLIETLMTSTEPVKESIEEIRQTLFNLTKPTPSIKMEEAGDELMITEKAKKALEEVLDRYKKDQNFASCSDIVERLRKFEERLCKLEERLYKLEEGLCKLEEKQNRTDEQMRKLTKRLRKLDYQIKMDSAGPHHVVTSYSVTVNSSRAEKLPGTQANCKGC